MVRSALSILALTAALPAVAQTSALVIGTTDPAQPSVFADSYNVAQALRAAGFDEVRLMRDEPAARVTAAWERGADLVYVTGPVPATLAERLTVPGGPGAVMLDDCAFPSGASGAGLARATQAGLCDVGGLAPVLIAATPEALADPGLLVPAAWTEGAPTRFAVTPPPAASPVATVTDAVVSISPVSPVAAPATAQAVRPTLDSVGTVEDEQIAIFIAPPSAELAAQPTAAGLPRPSIIVGLIEPTPASFETVEDTPEETAVAGGEVTFDTLEARRTLRDTDPDLFETLLTGGAFDPPDVELVVALQTELKRMNCYRSTIDGDWGPGSRRSVGEYFAQIDGEAAADDAPTIDLYRQLVRKDDVACPTPVATQRPAASSGGTRTTRTTTTRSTQPARTQTTRTTTPRQTTTRTTTTRTQQPSSGGQRTIGGGSLQGVFR